MNPNDILREYFGYDSFREGQEPIIRQILSGGDALGIMPTGAGKSICYQVPAMLMDGLTVVISPLISLMEDQVAALNEAGIPAACLHSNLTPQDYARTVSAAKSGGIRLLYAAPERLMTDLFQSLTRTVRIAMLAVDEAHCISQWGQDFRPAYLDIAAYIDTIPQRPVVAAFTATATKSVREDIRRLLKLRDPLEAVTGFDRKNLRWLVRQPAKKYDALLAFLRKHPEQSGIIYCISRRATDEICSKLCADGFPAARYHAGLPAEERAENQERFLHDTVRIMVATNAFGMGIDKSNVSFVVHYNMPKSMEAYYQEAGRAGRDGAPAECLLLYSPQDIRINQMLIDNDSENDRLTPEQREAVRKNDLARLQSMVQYSTLTDCLRHYILRYFGENAPPRCGNCGSCLANTETIDATVQAQKILSCVYRARQRGIGCGVRLLCDVLQGKSTKQITALRLDSISTYGLLADVPRTALEQMVHVLISRGYLAVRTEDYSSLALTAQAAAVLKGEETVQMALPKHGEKPGKQQRILDGTPNYRVDEDLFQRLRKLRERLAAKEYVPAYVVFSDATLREMCIRLPKTPDELLAVPGVGKYKQEKYGGAFLETVLEYLREQQGMKHVT